MTEILTEFRKSASSNITGVEFLIFLCLAILAWKGKHKFPAMPVLYSVFLIVYITLFRRAPGYNENIRIRLMIWNNAGVFIGNLLNLVLYLPFGYTLETYAGKVGMLRFAGIGLTLSVVCEGLQYFTGRGTADSNDVIFNTLGMVLGSIIGTVLSNRWKNRNG